MTIYAISDLHTDNRENRVLIEAVSTSDYQKDSLIIAGDISNNLKVIEATLMLLSNRFKHLFFTPGNHEFWISKDEENSLGKFNQILSLCADLGIQTGPKMVENVWVVPLFSWYERAFFPAESGQPAELEGWGDYHLCKWPQPPDFGEFDPCDYFIGLNGDSLRSYDRPVISFSHFVPRLELIPPQDLLYFKSLPLVAGSAKIETLVRAIGSQVHVFGHTHINVDQTLDGIRYLQNALRYPRERKAFGRPNGLKLAQVWPLVDKEDDIPWQRFL